MALARRSGGSPRVFFSDPHRGHKAHARGKPLLWLLGTLASSTTSPRADIFDFADQPARWPRLRTCAFRAAVTARTRAPECSEPPLPLELPRSASRGARGVPMAYLGPEDSAALAAAAPALRARRGALHKAAVDLCARARREGSTSRVWPTSDRRAARRVAPRLPLSLAERGPS